MEDLLWDASRETEGGRAFAVTAVEEWNKVPIKITSSQNSKLFKKNYVNYLKESCIGLDLFPISFLKSILF